MAKTTKNNRFKKKALAEEAKNIVSSTPLESSKATENPIEAENISSVGVNIFDLINTTSTNKIVIEKEEKIKMTKLGTSIKMNLKKDLDNEAKKYDRTANNIVNILLANLYDKKTKSFDLKISKKETSKITSYHIKSEHYKAIEKLCKTSGYNKSEVFNMLIEKGLSNLK